MRLNQKVTLVLSKKFPANRIVFVRDLPTVAASRKIIQASRNFSHRRFSSFSFKNNNNNVLYCLAWSPLEVERAHF